MTDLPRSGWGRAVAALLLALMVPGMGVQAQTQAITGAPLQSVLTTSPASPAGHVWGAPPATTPPGPSVAWAQWAEPPAGHTPPTVTPPLRAPTPWQAPVAVEAPAVQPAQATALGALPYPATGATGYAPTGVAGMAAPTPVQAGNPSGWPSLSFPLPGAPADPLPSLDATPELEMFVGETQLFPAPDVGRIAVGNGRILHAVVADEREVVVFARTPGVSSLTIWSQDGSSRTMRITVVPGDTRRVQQELSGFLSRIPNARSAVVGDKLIIEGEDLSDADQARIAALARRYPQVVDFTSQVGWDRMVMIDVQVVEVPTSRMRELGVRWDPATTGGITAGAAWDVGASRAVTSRPGDAPIEMPFPTLGAAGYLGLNALLSSRLHALAQSGEAVILAQPQLMARSGTTASFLAGGQLPYATVDANGNSSTVFKPYGVTLDVTPRVDRNGTVRARIEVEVSAVDPAVTTPSGPALRTRRTATEFNVRSGQTLVLGGFLSREHSREVDKVPLLGDLPLLGGLFRATREQRKDTELAIFVTPVVVSAANASLAERVTQGRALLTETFPEAPRLNVPIRADFQWLPEGP